MEVWVLHEPALDAIFSWPQSPSSCKPRLPDHRVARRPPQSQHGIGLRHHGMFPLVPPAGELNVLRSYANPQALISAAMSASGQASPRSFTPPSASPFTCAEECGCTSLRSCIRYSSRRLRSAFPNYSGLVAALLFLGLLFIGTTCLSASSGLSVGRHCSQ